MTYIAADDRYDRMLYRRCGRAGSTCPRSRSGSGGTSATTGRSRRAGPSCSARSTSASPTSTSRTTTGRRTGPPRKLRPDAGDRPRAVPGRARHLHEGGLGHVAGAVRRSRVAQVPARQPRSEPGAHGVGLRRHLLLAPPRPETPLEETMGALATAFTRARRCTPASRRTLRPAPPRPRQSFATSASSCSSTSLPTRC